MIMSSSLCSPDSDKSCFACCPPIRPPGYVHADYENIIKRILRENSIEYCPDNRGIKPVTGFSCWALGYVDAEYKRIGCLLHPQSNNGHDLRYRIDYGSKCVRESCPEEKIFSIMEEKQKYFWLNLTTGMESFEYSNRNTNILFNILGWGDRLLAEISDNDNEKYYSKKHFLKVYPFLNIQLSPRGHSFPVTRIVLKKGPALLTVNDFKIKYLNFSRTLTGKIKTNFKFPPDGVFVHKLGIKRDFSDYIRLTLGVSKADITLVNKLHDFVLDELDSFCEKV